MNGGRIVKIPIKEFPDGQVWLLLDTVLGKRVILRAHDISVKKNVMDYDTHHCPEAHAAGSVKCRAKAWDISKDIVSTNS